MARLALVSLFFALVSGLLYLMPKSELPAGFDFFELPATKSILRTPPDGVEVPLTWVNAQRVIELLDQVDAIRGQLEELKSQRPPNP